MTEPKDMKVVQLRAALKKRGLETKGLKAELILRLEEAIAGDTATADKTENVGASNTAQAAAEEPAGGDAAPEKEADPPGQEESASGQQKDDGNETKKDEEAKGDTMYTDTTENTQGSEAGAKVDAESAKPAGTKRKADVLETDASKPKADEKSSDESAQPAKKAKPAEEAETPVVISSDTLKNLLQKEIAVPAAAPTAVTARKARASTGEGDGAAEGDATTVLLVKNFVRPCPVPAVKRMLGETGTVTDFWMNAIKTHCYVTYETAEQAKASKAVVHLRQWPEGTGRALHATFVTVEERDAGAKEPEKKPIEPPARQNKGNNKNQGGETREQKNGGQAASKPEPPAPDAPVLTLDELFMKTKTEPNIYYLPLTDEEVAAKKKGKTGPKGGKKRKGGARG